MDWDLTFRLSVAQVPKRKEEREPKSSLPKLVCPRERNKRRGQEPYRGSGRREGSSGLGSR